MGYNTFRFGSLYMEGVAQNFPQQPLPGGDIPEHDQLAHTIHVGATLPGMAITWVKPEGYNLLVADRVLLSNISWTNLAMNRFVTGQETIIRGHRFRCRLLGTGGSKDAPSEWDEILDVTGGEDSLWHWRDMYFWGREVSTVFMSRRAVRGGQTARTWAAFTASQHTANTGFRPVLEVMSANWDIAPNCVLDGLEFRRDFIFDETGVCPTLQPIEQVVFAGIPNEGKVRMYTLTEDGQPVHPHGTWKDKAHLCLTDQYFGDEYLIPWIISNGIAVADIKVSQQFDNQKVGKRSA